MGETISYSSGKVPESSLVREARERLTAIDRNEDKSPGLYYFKVRSIAYTLCDALEEKEREVERLRQGCAIWKQASNINFQGLCGRDRQIANQELEIQRLRQQLKICTKALDKACRDGG